MIRIIGDLVEDWRYLDERIETVTDEIEALARADEGCQQLITVPGVGPIISSAMVAAIGNGAAFCKGRDFAAWLGLVPKQMSTGDRTILGRITKRGKSLSAHALHPRRPCRSAPSYELGEAQFWTVAHDGCAAHASQCSDSCARQQVGADRLDRLGARTSL